VTVEPTSIPVALRAYTLRRVAGAETLDSPAPPWSPGRTPRPRRDNPRWPKHVLVLDTETTADEAQRLILGCGRMLRRAASGAYALVEEVLFYADDLPTRQPAAFAELRRYTESNGLRLLSRRDFMDTVFKQVALDLKGLIVGFNLPFDLSRLAIESGEARGRYRGGFSFVLWDYPDKATGLYVEHPFRPRVCVKSLDSKRAFIGFTRPMRTGEATAKTARGHFLDLRTLAFALSAKSHSLASACAAFGVVHGKLAVEEHGKVTANYIEYNRRDVLATHELFERLRAEFNALGLSLSPTRAFSPASIAKAALRAMGLRPPREKAPAIMPSELGHAMNAFFGGRAECRIRRVPVPVVTVDFRSMYPTVNCLLGLWPVLTAEVIRVEENTERFRALLTRASLDAALAPALWPELRGFVEIEPEGDILPVRAKYSDVRDSLNIGVNRFTSPVAHVYAAPDVYASALLTGKAPRVRRAWRLVGDGVQPGLVPIVLAGRIPVDPRTADFFRLLIEERVRVNKSAEYSREDQERSAQLLKIVANSGSYGIFAQMDREELPSETTVPITVFGHGDPFEQTTAAPESLGEFCFPPIAALIASGARLMLALLERCVTDHGGTYAFCDTDSMAIVATREGGLIACNGGTADPSDDIAAVRALTWRDVEQIRTRFDALNPYDRAVIPSILNIEDVNYQNGVQREISTYVISAKRYALFTQHADGSVHLEKVSEHGLGHVLSPLPAGQSEKWPDVLWELILAEEFGQPRTMPLWLKYPAVSRVSVSAPAYFRGFLRRYAEIPYPERVKPFGFLLSAQVARLAHPEGYDPKSFHLLAPFSSNHAKWGSQVWTDTYSGQSFGIATAPSYVAGIVRVRSVEDLLAEFIAHGEVKSATPDGAPAGCTSRGLLSRRHVSPSEIRLIGKESNAIEMAASGLLGDWGAVLSSYSQGRQQPSAETLTASSAAALARAHNVSIRTVRAWRRKARPEEP
jgi:hypothetical protein